MDVKTAIRTGDADALRGLLAEDPSLANVLIRWGNNGHLSTHALHFISDMVFSGTLARGRELALVDALIDAGADLDYRAIRSGETHLIGAASLGAEDVGIRLLNAGANPRLLGGFGESALHWAAMLGESRLSARLISVSDLDLPDEKYKSSPLGWAIQGWSNPPGGNLGCQDEVVDLLLAAGARIEPAQALKLAALGGGRKS